MSDAVKPKRSYDSTGRQEQARRVRSKVLATARELFLQQGYAATTIGGIAGRAGVSVETVYKAFGNKAGLLKVVFDVAIAGDDEPVPLVERDMVRRIEAEPDGRRKLAIYGEHLSVTRPRSAPIELLARQAAASDPGAAEVWRELGRERLTGMTLFATHLQTGGHLRPGVSVEEGRAMCSGPTSRPRCTSCWSWSGAGPPSGTAASSPRP